MGSVAYFQAGMQQGASGRLCTADTYAHLTPNYDQLCMRMTVCAQLKSMNEYDTFNC